MGGGGWEGEGVGGGGLPVNLYTPVVPFVGQAQVLRRIVILISLTHVRYISLTTNAKHVNSSENKDRQTERKKQATPPPPPSSPKTRIIIFFNLVIDGM